MNSNLSCIDNLIMEVSTLSNVEVLSVSDVAKRLGVNHRSVARWIQKGIAFPNAYKKNPMLKNSHYVVPVSDVEEFEESRGKASN